MSPLKVSSIFRSGSTLKCRNALGFDFAALSIMFSVPLYIYILALQSTKKELAMVFVSEPETLRNDVKIYKPPKTLVNEG